MIAESVSAALGRCDRCGRYRDRLHRDSLGWICAACFVGNPENVMGHRHPSMVPVIGTSTTEQEAAR